MRALTLIVRYSDPHHNHNPPYLSILKTITGDNIHHLVCVRHLAFHLPLQMCDASGVMNHHSLADCATHPYGNPVV
jgi:hypothetical protein